MIRSKELKISPAIKEILKADLSFEQLNKLNNNKALTVDEQKLVKRVIDSYSVLGHNDFKNIIKDFGVEYDEIKQIDPNKIDSEIFKFLELRALHNVHRHLDEVLLSSKSLSDYELKVQEVITGKYLKSLKRKHKLAYEQLADPFVNSFIYKNFAYVKTYVERLDDYAKFYSGNINTVVSNSKEIRHAYTINQVYNLIRNKTNVCLLSLEYSEKDILLELICKHSFNGKFSNGFTLKEAPSKDLYREVYEDFGEFTKYLKVYDEDDFIFMNKQSIEKELIVTDREFITETEKGTDVLLVEGINKMRFDDRNKRLTTRNQIEHEYYLLLRDLAHYYLGTNGKVVIIVTNSNLEIYDEDLYDNLKFNITHLSENSNNFSDVIITLRTSESLKKDNEVEISVLKSVNEKRYRNIYKLNSSKYEFILPDVLNNERKNEKDKNIINKNIEDFTNNIKIDI